MQMNSSQTPFSQNSSNNTTINNRGFISNILQRLPYVNGVVDVADNNTRYELFDRLSKRSEQKLLKQSVITGPSLNMRENHPTNGFGSDMGYHQFIYAQIDSDKIRRLSEYRRMGSFAEVSDCLDEISGDFVNKDENGKIINLKFDPYNTLQTEEKAEIEKEFYKFISIFDLEHKGPKYCRQYLVEGELFFENIVHSKLQNYGIIGALAVPGELINPIYDNLQNNLIENFIFQKPIELSQDPRKKQLPMAVNVSNNGVLQQQLITFHSNQITYIHSDMWNDDQTIRIPFIENCRRAYKQLSLLEDAIIIYRMVRAPERLKFTIDVGNMPPHKIESYMQQLKQQYWNKQTYNSSNAGSASPGMANAYNPQSMLDSYWFARRNGEAGSDVSVLQGGENLGKLEDLMYFVNKLYKSLKVPTTRLNPQEVFKDGAEILREELKFAKFIMTIQSAFAAGFKSSFISHLKLRGWWQQYKLHESYFNLDFTPPSNFFALRQQNLFELKQKNFASMAQVEGVSKTFCQRHYLDMSDEKIGENQEWLRKDAALAWELAQITNGGPNWRDHQAAAEQAASAATGGESPMSGGGGGPGPSEIPEFGGSASGSEMPQTQAEETPQTEPAGETETAEPTAAG